MKRYAFFPGCKIPHHLEAYGQSALALLNQFGIEPIDVEFNCCGYPVRDLDFDAFILSGARNLALAEETGLDIVTPCQCCFGSLKFVEYFLNRNETLKHRVNGLLDEDGLQWTGRATTRHLLTVLHNDVGPEAIKNSVANAYRGLKVAVHSGCHALRPARVTRFDNPVAPNIFRDLVRATGAESVYWSMSAECCGNPQWDKNRTLALDQMHRKLINARNSGANVIGTACTYCQLQFNQAGLSESAGTGHDSFPTPIPVSQLIGLSVGLPLNKIGLSDRDLALLNRYR